MICAVTGAFGYSGSRIAARLLNDGFKVRTLTNSPDRPNPFGGRIPAYPYNFEHFDGLVQSLKGASVLYNTYWVRFEHGKDFSQQAAIHNTQTLFRAAKAAGVERVVHISITNPSEDSPFEYFRGKALLERSLIESGLSYGIVRPAVLFGGEDILINNIAYLLRNSPIFAIPGRGKYRLQPIHVDDLAALVCAEGKRDKNTIIDAIGPETFTFRQLVETLDRTLRTRCWITSMPAPIATFMGAIIGDFLGDVLITSEEVRALMAELLYVGGKPTGEIPFTAWAVQSAAVLGRRYHSETARRTKRDMAYSGL